MSLYKRGNVWWMEVKDEAGKVAQLSTKMKDKSDAEAVLLAHEARKTLKVVESAASAVGLKEAFEATMLRKRADGNRSVDSDQQRGQWWVDKLGDIDVTKITGMMILAAVNKKRAEDKIANATSNRYIAMMKTILTHCEESKWIEFIPKVRLFKEPKGRTRHLETEQIPKLLEQLPEHLKDMVTFALSTGLRTSNVTKLQWDWVNMRTRTITIPPWAFKQERTLNIPIFNAAYEVLEKQVGRHPLRVFTYKTERKGCPAVYRPVGKIRTDAWHKALARAEIADFHPHDLRHTWATHHLRNGTEIHVVKELGGWSKLDMVLRYGHLDMNTLRPAEVNSCV